ncbi:MAG: leucine-rich repeat domain-containing protein, partial [Prevotellaceae bacterium]|nr:leucine-rich repeat domain-containing protein [Prevotellaceae bacterium]
GNSAFKGCESLKSICIPDSVTFIGNSAFFGCESLKSICIPDSVTFIGDSAFQRCESLKSICIPESVTSIGEYAFWYCSSLKTIYCYAPTPPSLNYSFDNTKSSMCLHVPVGTKHLYAEADEWKDFGTIVDDL